MKRRLSVYDFVLLVLIGVLASIIIALKMPQQKNEYIHIGIAVYNMEDTFIQNYVEQLQDALETYDFSGKKILYEIFDAENSANRQKKQFQYLPQNFASPD